MKRLLLVLFGLTSAAFGGSASAANAYSQGIVHMRAGPSTEYPVVMSIPPNSLLQVSGCLDDYTWCDVDWEGNHGWVYGNYLYYDYQNRRVPVLQFGASLGVGIVSFSIGDYWPRYYAGRPWYGRESYWLHRPPPPRRPPPPPPPRPGGLPPRPVTPPRPPRPAPVRPPRPRPTNPSPGERRPSAAPDATGARAGCAVKPERLKTGPPMSDADYDTWVVCRHKFPDSGRTAVITVNTSLENRAIFADYPYHVCVAIEAAPQSVDASGRIGAHESQHLLNLSRVIRESLECEEQHLIAITHGAGARTLESYARDGAAIARRLAGLKDQKTWDRNWTFEVKSDPQGKLSEIWRDIARASEDHHLAINVPHCGASDHHHFLF